MCTVINSRMINIWWDACRAHECPAEMVLLRENKNEDEDGIRRPAEHHSLKRELGLFSAVSLILSVMIGENQAVTSTLRTMSYLNAELCKRFVWIDKIYLARDYKCSTLNTSQVFGTQWEHLPVVIFMFMCT